MQTTRSYTAQIVSNLLMKKTEPITHQQAVDQYYGGVIKLSETAFPWKCNCGYKNAYSIKDIFNHITEVHGERLKK